MSYQKPEKSEDLLKRESVNKKREKHKGKRVSQMTKAEQDELLEAIAQALGLADENGAIT